MYHAKDSWKSYKLMTNQYDKNSYYRQKDIRVIKDSPHQEDKAIINIYAPNDRAPK